MYIKKRQTSENFDSFWSIFMFEFVRLLEFVFERERWRSFQGKKIHFIMIHSKCKKIWSHIESPNGNETAGENFCLMRSSIFTSEKFVE